MPNVVVPDGVGPVIVLFVPVAIGAAIGAIVFYSVRLPALCLLSLIQVLAVRPTSLRAPSYFKAGDAGVYSYFYRPAFDDFRHVVENALKQTGGLIDARMEWATSAFAARRRLGQPRPGRQRPGDDLFFPPPPPKERAIKVPIGFGWLVFGWLGVAIGAIGGAIIVGTYLLATSVLAGSARLCALLLRGLDSAMLRVRNIAMICPAPNCHERVPYPSYRCPGSCGELKSSQHTMPGRFGVFRYACPCGGQMPTLLLLGSARLNAFCPHGPQGHPLPHRPGMTPEIVLPFVGAKGAGKTQLMTAVAILLRCDPGLRAEFADLATRQNALDAANRLLNNAPTPSTIRESPRGSLLRVGQGRGIKLLQMFDASGEDFYSFDEVKHLRYLKHARTFVLVIDPLAVDQLWQGLPVSRQTEFEDVRSRVSFLELAYQPTQQRLAEMKVRLAKARLAIVISRADALDRPATENPEDWAVAELGLGNLIRSARFQFAEVKVFLTGSVIDPAMRLHPSVAAFVNWVLEPAAITGLSQACQVSLERLTGTDLAEAEESGVADESGGSGGTAKAPIQPWEYPRYTWPRRSTLGVSLLALATLMFFAAHLLGIS